MSKGPEYEIRHPGRQAFPLGEVAYEKVVEVCIADATRPWITNREEAVKALGNLNIVKSDYIRP